VTRSGLRVLPDLDACRRAIRPTSDRFSGNRNPPVERLSAGIPVLVWWVFIANLISVEFVFER